MEITSKNRNQLRLQNIIFILLFCTVIGLLAWLSLQYRFEYDFTANKRNSLSPVTIKLLEKIPGEIKITSFIPDSAMQSSHKYVRELVGRYQKYKKDITLEIINPDIAPDKVRQLRVTHYGETIVEYQGRNEHINQLNEKHLSNTLQRLLRQGERLVLFVSGHGERSPDGKANFSWSHFATKLHDKGFKTALLKLAENPRIENASAVVIASPQTDFLPGEVKLLLEYIKQGGNLLWAQEPATSLHGLKPLADLLGIDFYPGTIVDPTTQMLNIKDPTFSLITSYPQHAITRDFQYISIFPRAVGIVHNKDKDNWQAKPFLQTAPRSWSETGVLKGSIDYNKDSDFVGPLTIGLAMTKKNDEKNKKQQRIVILGDGDFLSNTYLGNQGNMSIGFNIMNWLSNDDDFLDIPDNSAIDRQIVISDLAGAIFGLFFLVVLPLVLLISGILIWYRRRNS